MEKTRKEKVMPKPLKIDLPLPDIEKIQPCKTTAMIIAPAYAGLHGEITATLQYIYHHFNFLAEGDQDTADVLMQIAVAEMEHVDILGKMILKLGVQPVYSLNPPYKYNFYNTSAVAYSNSPQKMLLDDISGELSAITQYENILKNLNNEPVEAVITRIILDEQLHVRALKELLSDTYVTNL